MTEYAVASVVATVPTCPSPPGNPIVLARDANPSALNVTAGRPVAVAVSVFKPARRPRVHEGDRAMPAVSVVTVAGVPMLPPPRLMVNVTGTPPIAFPYWSLTRAAGFMETALPTSALWPSPANAVSCEATSTRPVAVNVIGLPASPGALTVMAFPPTSVPRRQPTTLTVPDVSDTGVALTTLPPPAAMAALTVVPETELPNWSTILT